MNRKIKFDLMKLNKIMIVLTIILSMCFINVKNTAGYQSSQELPFTVGKEIVYPSWWSQKCPSIPKQWSTNMMYYNGKIAYCMEASKETPPNGHYASEVIKNNSMVRKLLYYGYGGAGSTKADGTPVLFMASESIENQYLYTHILLSIAYSGDAFGCDLDALEPLGIGLKGLYNAVQNMPDPESEVYFHPGTESGKKASFTAFYNKDTKEQMTNTVKFEGSHNAEIVIQLQEKVTIHNVTTGQSQTGGKATVHGGESFYFTAPCTFKINDDLSLKVDGQGCAPFTALAIHSGGNNQTIGSWDFNSDEAQLYIDIDWMDFGSLRLSKVDNVSQFQKGSKFRLVSTSYNGYDETFEVTKDKDGDYELLIEGLPIGTYALTEVDCEDYFAPAIAQWTVEIQKDKTTKQIVVNTLRPTGNLTITKKLEDANDGALNVADHDITKTSYKIIAKDDILDTVSLKKLYAKGDVITVGSGKCIIDASNNEQLEYSKGVQLLKGTDNKDGSFSVDENGALELSGIPLGKYQVVENSCPDGYVLDTTKKDIQFTQQDYTTTIYYQSVDQTNKITKTVFSKKTVTGEDELEGAKLEVKDKDGKVVDSWTSGKKAHEIDGLKAGETYTLTEIIAPNGYVKATEIKFTVKDDGTVQRVEMKDKQVTISKSTVAGDELIGASMQIFDEDGNVVDKWISEDKAHYANNLEEGKTYTLHEDLAPIGYNVANDIEFKVTKEKENQTVIMTDTIVEVSKVDEKDQLLKGAKLEVVSTKTKNIVDKWTTRQHLFDIDDEMKAELEAGNTVSDMMISEDDSSTLYKITPNQDGDYILMLQANGETSYYNIDINGDETTHMIQGLIVGQEYILRETKTPDGYATAKEQTFTAGEDKDISLMMVDQITKVEVSKQDITTQKELEGAKLQVSDKEGNIIDQWTSGKEPHMIQGLIVGQTYTLTETIAPKNYKVAQSIEFKIEDTGEVQKVVMYDELLPVKKVKTGDNTHIIGWCFSFLAALVILLGRIYFIKVKKMK